MKQVFVEGTQVFTNDMENLAENKSKSLVFKMVSPAGNLGV